MKKIRKLMLFAIVAAGISAGFTGCTDDDDWVPVPPYSWQNAFHDQNLNGFWQLTQINGQPAGEDQANYLYFEGNGHGEYYYYFNGEQKEEETLYWCRQVNGVTRYQINLQYESNTQPVTMNYWFTDNGQNLWMQWRANMATETYVYTRINNAPW